MLSRPVDIDTLFKVERDVGDAVLGKGERTAGGLGQLKALTGQAAGDEAVDLVDVGGTNISALVTAIGTSTVITGWMISTPYSASEATASPSIDRTDPGCKEEIFLNSSLSSKKTCKNPVLSRKMRK